MLIISSCFCEKILTFQKSINSYSKMIIWAVCNTPLQSFLIKEFLFKPMLRRKLCHP